MHTWMMLWAQVCTALGELAKTAVQLICANTAISFSAGQVICVGSIKFCKDTFVITSNKVHFVV